MGTVKVDFWDRVWIITPTGDRGRVDVEGLRATLRWVFAPRTRGLGTNAVVIDLSGVALFDSSVAAAITEAHDAAERDPDLHLALVVESADCSVVCLLRALGLTDAVPTFTDRAAVLSALADAHAPVEHTQSPTTRERLAFMAATAFKHA